MQSIYRLLTKTCCFEASMFHFSFSIFLGMVAPQLEKTNLRGGGQAIEYTKTKLNILRKIKLIDNLITIVKRNLKKKH